MLKYVNDNPQTTFLFGQTKDPRWMKQYRFPQNVILAITLETNLTQLDTPSKYKSYYEVSCAPSSFARAANFFGVEHKRKAVIIEPILQFSPFLVDMIRPIKPEFVYVGYDTKNCKLPEPTLAETEALISTLEKAGAEVRLKTIRKAWYE